MTKHDCGGTARRIRQGLGAIDAVTMIQSNFTSGAGVGNLEVIGHWQGELLFFWREDIPPYRWHGPSLLNPEGAAS